MAREHVEPAPHETDMYLRYTPPEQAVWDGLAPYWTLVGFLLDADGYVALDEVVVDGESLDVEVTYSKSDIAARPSDTVDGALYELDVKVRGDGERKLYANISPRFPAMETTDGERISVPFDHVDADEGVTVQFEGSNLELEEYPRLFHRCLQEVAAHLDADLHHEYLAPLTIDSGSIVEHERYIRYTRSASQAVIGRGGLMQQMMMLLSDERGTKATYDLDNEDAVGKNHRVKLQRPDVQRLFSDHVRGRQLKSYLLKNPDNPDEDDPTYHPKLGALFRQSLNRNQTVAWSDRDELRQRLNETLINVLAWADLPTDGGPQFVADDHFDASTGFECPIRANPLPTLEARQETLLVSVLRDMTDADREIVETVATDGGQSAEAVADEAGYSLSTIYRCLQRLDGVLESDDGHVRFVSQKLREDVRALVETVERTITNAADRAAEALDIEVRQSASSAFDKWLAKYGAEFDFQEDDRSVVRIDTVLTECKAANRPLLADVIQEMFEAWLQDGRDVEGLGDVLVEVEVAGRGQVRAPARILR